MAHVGEKFELHIVDMTLFIQFHFDLLGIHLFFLASMKSI